MGTDKASWLPQAVKEIKAAIVRAFYFGIGRYVSRKTKTEKMGHGRHRRNQPPVAEGNAGLARIQRKRTMKMRQFYEAWQTDAVWPSATAKLECVSPHPSS